MPQSNMMKKLLRQSKAKKTVLKKAANNATWSPPKTNKPRQTYAEKKAEKKEVMKQARVSMKQQKEARAAVNNILSQLLSKLPLNNVSNRPKQSYKRPLRKTK